MLNKCTQKKLKTNRNWTLFCVDNLFLLFLWVISINIFWLLPVQRFATINWPWWYRNLYKLIEFTFGCLFFLLFFGFKIMIRIYVKTYNERKQYSGTQDENGLWELLNHSTPNETDDAEQSDYHARQCFSTTLSLEILIEINNKIPF